MAEGGYEDFELEEREEYRREYDNLDRETLNDLYGELENVRVDDPKYGESRQRMVYIDSIRGDEAETSFTRSRKYGQVPKPPGKYDGRTIKRAVLKDRRLFLSEHLGVGSVKGGTAAEKLVNETRIVFGRNGKPSGIEFEGVKSTYLWIGVKRSLIAII